MHVHKYEVETLFYFFILSKYLQYRTKKLEYSSCMIAVSISCNLNFYLKTFLAKQELE